MYNSHIVPEAAYVTATWYQFPIVGVNEANQVEKSVPFWEAKNPITDP